MPPLFFKSLVVFKLFSVPLIFYSFTIICLILNLLLSSRLELIVLSQSESTSSSWKIPSHCLQTLLSLSFLLFSPSMTPIRCMLDLLIFVIDILAVCFLFSFSLFLNATFWVASLAVFQFINLHFEFLVAMAITFFPVSFIWLFFRGFSSFKMISILSYIFKYLT